MRLAFGALLVAVLCSSPPFRPPSSAPQGAEAAAVTVRGGSTTASEELPEAETDDLLASHVCSRYEMRLRCDERHLVAVHDAMFASEVPEDAPPATPGCDASSTAAAEEVAGGAATATDVTSTKATATSVATTTAAPCQQDLRLALNSRCSGEVHCLFSLNRDEAVRRCRGEGSVLVRYRCVLEQSLVQKCGAHVRSPPEGYLSSPGFPHFYPALSDCSWLLEASPGQTVALRVLDVSLRPPAASATGLPEDRLRESDCLEDALSVHEENRRLFVACGESRLRLRTLRSTGRRLVVRLRTRSFVPARGFLLEYKFIGCPTPAAPLLGYLVHRTGPTAQFKCCKDHLFHDTLVDSRTLFCLRGHTWNDTVPETCTPRLSLFPNESVIDEDELPLLQGRRQRDGVDNDASMQFLADVLVPCLAMAFLLLGNTVVVIIILKLKKRRRRSLSHLTTQQPDIALLVPPQSSGPPPPWKHG